MPLPDFNEVLAKREAAALAGTGNIPLLLHEIRHALARLAAGDAPTVIDMRRVPLFEGEEAQLEEALGVGEVRAVISTIGPSEIVETQYPGVWRVTHKSPGGDVLSKFIEITLIPDILCAQREDVGAGLARLSRMLEDPEDREVVQ